MSKEKKFGAKKNESVLMFFFIFFFWNRGSMKMEDRLYMEEEEEAEGMRSGRMWLRFMFCFMNCSK